MLEDDEAVNIQNTKDIKIFKVKIYSDLVTTVFRILELIIRFTRLLTTEPPAKSVVIRSCRYKNISQLRDCTKYLVPCPDPYK